MVKKTIIQLLQADLGYQGNKKTFVVLKQVSLELCEGDCIGLVGLNGAGKSTLIKSICGELQVLNGKVLLEQLPIDNYALHELSKKVALVLTGKVSGFNLTLFDLVASGQMPYTNLFHRLSEKHLGVINEAMQTIGISQLSDRPVNELSDGNFQKAMIAKALAQQTQTILLDEPGAYLDYGSKHRLFEGLQKLAKEQNKCILASSHDLQLVRKYCNKILILSEGSAELVETEAAAAHPGFLVIGGAYLPKE
jgi:iron complex transport system ATP-binding protein